MHLTWHCIGIFCVYFVGRFTSAEVARFLANSLRALPANTTSTNTGSPKHAVAVKNPA